MKEKWVNFYTRMAAGAIVTGSVIAANRMAKKYGQKLKQDKPIKVKINNTANLAIDKFMSMDDEKIVKLVSKISKK